MAVVIYTSGTGGDAKGAMLTHRALIANIEQVASAQISVVDPDDVVLVLLPLTHVYGLAGTLGAVARAAATAVLVDGVDVVRALPLLPQYGDHERARGSGPLGRMGSFFRCRRHVGRATHCVQRICCAAA